MARTIISSGLTTCDAAEDGEAIRLDFLDEVGRPVSVELPFAQAQSIVMTLPSLLSKALHRRTKSEDSRFVFSLGRWSIERTDVNCLILNFATADGFEVSFGIPFEVCQAMGWALKHEGKAATGAIAEDSADPTVFN